ncbi:prepilin-type N-terminal cleavage/methylation domain-containing protein [Candidatus Dojkabacteria bacterium]|nr:prepilin-type N-terminal cleavage/methylation domain-containing protein [Candidatus Dojkabacteria bacterium]
MKKGLLIIRKRQSQENRTDRDGFSLVEVLLAITMLAIITTAVFGAVFYAQESNALVANRNRAVALAEEGLNAAQAIRDEDFANLADGTYGLTTASNQWALSGSSDTVDIFTREIEISSIDSNTKRILSRITWTQNSGRNGEIELVSYLSDIYRSEIIDEQEGDWTEPSELSNLDIPSNGDHSHEVLYSNGYAFLLQYWSSGTNLFAIDVSDSANPTLADQINLPGNNTSGLELAGNYAMVSSDSNNQEFIVIDISAPTNMSVEATVNLDGNDDTTKLHYDAASQRAFVTKWWNNQEEVYVIDMSTPSSPSLLDSFDVSATINDITVKNDYVILATSDQDEIFVYDISDLSNQSLVETLALQGGNDANRVYIYDNYLYVGRANGKLAIVDATDPTNLVLLSENNFGQRIEDIRKGPGDYLFLANRNFEVINISDPANPTEEASLNLPGNIYGIDYDSTLDLTFLTGTRWNEQFYIIEPGTP